MLMEIEKRLGNYVKLTNLIKKKIEVDENIYFKDNPYLAYQLYKLGQCQRKIFKNVEAIQAFEAAINIEENVPFNEFLSHKALFLSKSAVTYLSFGRN